MSELERAMKRLKDMGITVNTTARSGADSIAGRIQAEAERIGIAGPCGNRRCRLAYAHAGPCFDSSADNGGDERVSDNLIPAAFAQNLIEGLLDNYRAYDRAVFGPEEYQRKGHAETTEYHGQPGTRYRLRG